MTNCFATVHTIAGALLQWFTACQGQTALQASFAGEHASTRDLVREAKKQTVQKAVLSEAASQFRRSSPAADPLCLFNQQSRLDKA